MLGGASCCAVARRRAISAASSARRDLAGASNGSGSRCLAVRSTTTGSAGSQVGLQLRVLADAGRERLADPVELVEHHRRVGRPLVAVARGGAGDQGVDVPGDAGDGADGGGHVLVDVLVGHLDRRVALVRLRAGQQLVEDDTRGVHVGPGVGPAVDDQLGREVGDGADQDAAGRGVLGVGADRLGQPEVGDLDPAVVGDQDVLGLDVAVDQAGAVRRGQRREDRLEERPAPAAGSSGPPCGSRRAGCGPGPSPWRGRRCRPRRPGRRRHHVGVGEPGGGAGLAHEARGELVVVAETGVHHLDRDRAVEPDVGGLVDAGHAAARDPRPDPVATVQQAADQGVAAAPALARLGALSCCTSTLLRTGWGRTRLAQSYGAPRRSPRLPGPRRGAGHPLTRCFAGCGRSARVASADDTVTTCLADADLAALVHRVARLGQAAERLGVTPAKVRTMIRDHELAAAVPAPGPDRESRPRSSRTASWSRACPGC